MLLRDSSVWQGQRNSPRYVTHCEELGMVSIIAIVSEQIPNIFLVSKTLCAIAMLEKPDQIQSEMHAYKKNMNM